jgi:hypothetical protein
MTCAQGRGMIYEHCAVGWVYVVWDVGFSFFHVIFSFSFSSSYLLLFFSPIFSPHLIQFESIETTL